jgi:putative tricarboxylic transport membrane protein
MRRADAVAASTLLAVAAVAVYEAGRLPLGTPRNPGPGFVPWWTGAVLGGLALALLGQALAAPRPARAAATGGGVGRIAGLAGVLAAYVLLLEPVGYPACTFLLVLFMLRTGAPQRWPVAAGVAALAAVGSYLLFAVWLKVPLPPGPLGR